MGLAWAHQLNQQEAKQEAKRNKMNTSFVSIAKDYLRGLSAHRNLFALCFLVVAAVTIVLAFVWPKSYTSSSTIYADNSNILRPLMEGNAVATSIADQARMAREILFRRQFSDDILRAAGYEPARLSPAEKEVLITNIQNRTQVANVGRAPASLIQI